MSSAPEGNTPESRRSESEIRVDARAREERLRDAIDAPALVQALQDHAEGRIEMDATQIRAADILLRKLLPNAPAARKAESELTPFSVRITEPKV